MRTVRLEIVAGWTIGTSCDWEKDKIKAIKKNHTLTVSQKSYETKMCQAIIVALNKISYQRYQGQDRIHVIAEVFVETGVLLVKKA